MKRVLQAVIVVSFLSTFAVAYAEVEVFHAYQQPVSSGPSFAETELYRFTASNDGEGAKEMPTLYFDVRLLGMQIPKWKTGEFFVRKVKSDGTIDTTNTAAVAGMMFSSGDSAVIRVDFDCMVPAKDKVTFSIFLSNTSEDFRKIPSDNGIVVRLLKHTGNDFFIIW